MLTALSVRLADALPCILCANTHAASGTLLEHAAFAVKGTRSVEGEMLIFTPEVVFCIHPKQFPDLGGLAVKGLEARRGRVVM